jgi:hypothetical protein
MIKALLWDVDGALAETERDGHPGTCRRGGRREGATRDLSPGSVVQ